MEFDALGNIITAVALSAPRIAAAFIVLPLMAGDTVPALVRNSFFVVLAIVASPFAAAAAPMTTLSGLEWVAIVAKEIFVGLCIGFLFGIVFWAIGIVGNIIDTKVGSNLASVIDPLQGHQTSLTGKFLSQLAAWLFMASGGFLIFLNLLFGSYAVWPVTSGFPSLTSAGELLFVDGLARLMLLSLLLSAPVLIILFVVDMCLGLINRFAQQLNVLAISLAIKSWVATWVVLLCLGVFIEFVIADMGRGSALLDALTRSLA
ncbi:MAG: type III secretion system export apparatus subunit SctT, partial [Luteimonas sp.]